jgi:hypothetical protein
MGKGLLKSIIEWTECFNIYPHSLLSKGKRFFEQLKRFFEQLKRFIEQAEWFFE